MGPLTAHGRRLTVHSPMAVFISPENKAALLEPLNPQQREVVAAEGNGPLLVIAGAGTGKTQTLVYRLAYLIQNQYPPDRILLATFTNKAAREMIRRAEALLGLSIGSLWAGTFHHLAAKFLRRHAASVGFRPHFTILDREDEKDVIAHCLIELGLDEKQKGFPRKEVMSEIFSLSRSMEQPLESFLSKRYAYLDRFWEDIIQLYHRYTYKKKDLQSMDFDDLLVYAVTLLRESEKIRTLYQEKFRAILVDEFQDTNSLQGKMIDILAAPHQTLMVVGDDAQSIYAFRGARYENILEFPERYPHARIYKLEINYRSTPDILALANAILEQNKTNFKKTLRSVKSPRSKPLRVTTENSFDQAKWVVQEILSLQEEGMGLQDVAVLYRAHYHSLELQLELQEAGVPFEIRSGLRFFEQAHIKDILAFIKIVLNARDELSWRRILPMIPRIGKKTTQKIITAILATPDPLETFLTHSLSSALKSKDPLLEIMGLLKVLREKEASPPSWAIETIVMKFLDEVFKARYSNYQERLQDVEPFIRYARRFDSTQDFVQDLALVTHLAGKEVAAAGEPEQEEKEVLILSTIHQAKGLEWKAVFLIGLSDGRFPDKRSLNDEAALEEERRLFYVACTRSKERLYLVYPVLSEERSFDVIQKPSRFIEELPPALYEEIDGIVEDSAESSEQRGKTYLEKTW